MTAKDTPTPRSNAAESDIRELRGLKNEPGNDEFEAAIEFARTLERELAASAGGAPEGVWGALEGAADTIEGLIDLFRKTPELQGDQYKQMGIDAYRAFERARAALALRGWEVADPATVFGTPLPGWVYDGTNGWRYVGHQTASGGTSAEHLVFHSEETSAPVAPTPWRGMDALKAIKARIEGDWDAPCLQAFAPYSPTGSTKDHILQILGKTLPPSPSVPAHPEQEK